MNIIRSIRPENEMTQCACIDGKERVNESYEDYLHDESRLLGNPVNEIFFPCCTDEVSSVLQTCHRDRRKVTVSGARTGIVGGAVPLESDVIISLERMKKVLKLNENSIIAESGITLDELNQHIANNKPSMFYPVDPTETTASLGGTVATNASGARTYFYGPTRKWVESLTVVLSDGSILRLKRGDVIAYDYTFQIKFLGKEPAIFTFPEFSYPKTKSTIGYQFVKGMDAIDLFIGSEGTLGIITEVEIRLIPKPENRLYSVIWTKSENQSIKLLRDLKYSNLELLAIEYFDPNSLNILRSKRAKDASESVIPKFPDDASAALFIDTVYENEEKLIEISCELETILARFGLDANNTWSGLDERDLIRMKAFRHALPETINEIISQRKIVNPNIHKLSTDLSVPDNKLEEIFNIYHENLDSAGLEYVIFGHIGDNHLHVNMLPRTDNEITKAKDFYHKFAKEAVRLGGSVASEHGIGRLKRDFMKIQYPANIISSMWKLKNIFDPDGILNPGVLLP